MAWYFQTSPHDTHDLDSTQAAVLFDLPGRGKFMAQANRAGRFVVVDRTTGKAVVSTEYIKTKQFLGTDERGQPVPNPAKDPTPDGTISTNSGTNWIPPAYSPQTGLFYVNASRSFGIYYVYDLSDNPMGWGGGGGGGAAGGENALKAIDVKTGQVKWATNQIRWAAGCSRRQATSSSAGDQAGSRPSTRPQARPLWVGKVGGLTNGAILLARRKQYVRRVRHSVVAFVFNE
jgi:alcohol dehydrogenase (cytochrome c)